MTELLKSLLKTEKKENTAPPAAAEIPPSAVSESRARALTLRGRTCSNTRTYVSAAGLAAMIAEYAAIMSLGEAELLRAAGLIESAYAEVPQAECERLVTRVAAMYRTWTQERRPQPMLSPGIRI
jgi:hypothetical protein